MIWGLTNQEAFIYGAVVVIIIAAVGYNVYQRRQSKKLPVPPPAQAASGDSMGQREYIKHRERMTQAELGRLNNDSNQFYQDTLFPSMRSAVATSEELDGRVESMKNIALRIKQEQNQMSDKSDQLLDNLDIFVEKMRSIRKQYVDLANLIDTQFQIIDFELDAKNRILEYHRKNKQRRKNLPAELAMQHQNQEQFDDTLKKRGV